MPEFELETILVVDDIEAQRYVLRKSLERAGFKVIEAATGHAALAMLAHSPDLVVLDVNLPDITGFEVCRRLRAAPETAGIPVIHLSASMVERDSRIAGLSGGADLYLVQPFDDAELLATIRSLLRMRRAERLALTAAERWQETFDAIGDSVCMLDGAGRIVRANRALSTLLGASASELVGKDFHQTFLRAMGKLQSGTLPDVRILNARTTQEIQVNDRWFRFTVDPVVDEDGASSGGVKVIADITEQKHAERALAETRNQLAQQLDEMAKLHELIVRLSRSLTLEDLLSEVLSAVTGMHGAKQSCLMLYDHETQELYAARHLGFAPDYIEATTRVPRGLGASGTSIVTRSGVVVEDIETDPIFAAFRAAGRAAGYRSVYSTPLMTRSGDILGSIAVYFPERHRPSDREVRLTELYAHEAAEFIKTARDEQALRESEARFYKLFAADVLGIILSEGEVIVEANHAFLDMLGYQREDLRAGKLRWSGITPPYFRSRDESTREELVRTGTYRASERELIAADGSRVPVLVGGVLLSAPTMRALAFVLDLRQYKRTEEALRMNEKLAATGRLAATIAHEINNPMASVTNLLYLLENQPSLDEQARHYVQMGRQEVSRMAHIVKQMLGFYRESPKPVPTRIAEILESALGLYARKMDNAHISLITELDAACEITAFPGEMRQVFSNLLVNAMEAVPPGGTIKVRAYPSRSWIDPQVRGVRVVVSDNGPGIPRDYIRRVFEPFFTTKGEKGTGLGLWVTEGIIRKHGGFIRVRSSTRPGHSGTSFVIFVPERMAEAPPRRSPRAYKVENPA